VYWPIVVNRYHLRLLEQLLFGHLTSLLLLLEMEKIWLLIDVFLYQVIDELSGVLLERRIVIAKWYRNEVSERISV